MEKSNEPDRSTRRSSSRLKTNPRFLSPLVDRGLRRRLCPKWVFSPADRFSSCSLVATKNCSTFPMFVFDFVRPNELHYPSDDDENDLGSSTNNTTTDDRTVAPITRCFDANNPSVAFDLIKKTQPITLQGRTSCSFIQSWRNGLQLRILYYIQQNLTEAETRRVDCAILRNAKRTTNIVPDLSHFILYSTTHAVLSL